MVSESGRARCCTNRAGRAPACKKKNAVRNQVQLSCDAKLLLGSSPISLPGLAQIDARHSRAIGLRARVRGAGES